jgi:mono/diheme cytochrome c family protein
MSRKAVLVTIGFCVAFIAALVILTRTAKDEMTLRPDDRALVTAGQQLYVKHCASCHGMKLEGQPNWRQRGADGLLPAPPHDPSGHTWHHPDEQLIRMTKYGPTRLSGGTYRSAMPGYENVISDEEIVAVLSYIKSRWPAEIRARHDALNRSYAEQKKQGAAR